MEGLAFTGLRKGEGNRLRVKHVDLRAKVLHLIEGVAEKGGIGDVPIDHPRTLALFSRLCEGKDPDDFVFEVQSCNPAIRRACEKAGVDVLTHHGMWHFAASWWFHLTKDYGMVREWLRHAPDSDLAETIYTHNLEEGRSDARMVLAAQSPSNVIPLESAAKPVNEMTVAELESPS